MTLLANGVDVAVIALWLGHQEIRTTQQIYLHADMTLKRRALAATNELGATGKIRALPGSRLPHVLPRGAVIMRRRSSSRAPPTRYYRPPCRITRRAA
jgi:hypothetical protein